MQKKYVNSSLILYNLSQTASICTCSQEYLKEKCQKYKFSAFFNVRYRNFSKLGVKFEYMDPDPRCECGSGSINFCLMRTHADSDPQPWCRYNENLWGAVLIVYCIMIIVLIM